MLQTKTLNDCTRPATRTNVLFDILVIEDSKFVNDVVRSELEKLGHSCDEAYSLEEATQLLGIKKYAFIILDLNLPDTSGEELFFSIIRQSDAKIIILTSEQDSEVRYGLFKLGVLDYIIKDERLPRSIIKINETMQSIVENADCKILVIDDSALLRKQVEMILQARNYTILNARSAKEALEILDKETLDIILLALELPDMHGSELLGLIKENPLYCSTPVIVLSGTNNPELISKVLKGGASDFIQKPFNTEQFVLKVNLWSQLRRKTDHAYQLEQLLQEYKNTLNESAAISVVNPEGVFTYVSDKFCKLSGYTGEELVSKPFATVCSPDIPAAVFAELCQTAQGSKRWHGKFKLRSKTEQSHLVDTMINPIIDTSGNVIEYISIYNEV